MTGRERWRQAGDAGSIECHGHLARVRVRSTGHRRHRRDAVAGHRRAEPRPPGTPRFPIAFLATARRDSSPRLHPFCPVLAAGRLPATIPQSSPKGDDLRRDPRCAIHAPPGPDDDELAIQARATEADQDRAVRAAIITPSRAA